MQNDAEKQNNYNKKLYISLPLPHGQQHCDNDGEQEWCSGDCACPLPSLMWPAQVQFPEAAPYVSCVCCLILALVLTGFTVGTPVKTLPSKRRRVWPSG